MMWGAIIAAVAGLVSTLIVNNQQDTKNKRIAQTQADANQKYLQQQLDYNTPQKQMTRFQEAGLNPNLIYGQGSPGNQTAPLQYPDIKTTDLSRLTGDTMQTFNQTRLTNSQVQAQNANTVATIEKTQLVRLQQRVMEKNPLLNDSGFKAMIDNLVSSAALKQQQVRGQTIANNTAAGTGAATLEKIYKETDLLEQRFKLGEKDSAIKAEVLKSKEFQNAILEVQKKFMTDGDITPQHILQFVQLLLMKAL